MTELRRTPIGICVIDDHAIIHDGLRAMCERVPEFRFLGGAADAEQAIELVGRSHPDIAFLDLRIGSDNGFELCHRLRDLQPSLGVLVFSAFGNAELLAQAVRAGASGYLLKDTNTSRLPEIVREYRAAGSYFDPRIAGPMLIDSLSPDANRSSPPKQLSERELAIVRLIAEGASNYDIANELNISPHTVKFHVTALLRRFGVKRRAELVKVTMDRLLLP